MSEKQFKKTQTNLIIVVIIFEMGHLLWEYLNGGVLSHHLLNRADLPAISNWWGIIILPLFAWFCTTRIKKQVTFQPDDLSVNGKIPREILIGFFGFLLISLAQSVAFEFGYENIMLYIALGILIIALFTPFYKAERILGHFLGGVFTFGPVIPFIGILVFSTVSALSHLVVKPLLVSLWGYLGRTEFKPGRQKA